MITLNYSLDAGNVDSDAEWSEVTECQLRYGQLLGDVGFVIFEHDLSVRWGWVPVLDFALSLDSIADSLAAIPGNHCVFEFTESDATIAFTRSGELVDIEASYVPGVAYVGYRELHEAAKAFLGRVLRDAVQEHPGLAVNPFVLERFGNSPTID